MLHLKQDISDPSGVLNYVDNLRDLKDKLDAEQARWLEQECCILESRVHEKYTPFEFFLDAALIA